MDTLNLGPLAEILILEDARHRRRIVLLDLARRTVGIRRRIVTGKHKLDGENKCECIACRRLELRIRRRKNNIGPAFIDRYQLRIG